MKHRNHGFTIVEVLVFSTVALLLMTMLFQLFITATRHTEDSRLRVDLQQKAVLVIRKFTEDLGFASARGMTAVESGEDYVLAIRPVDPHSHGGWVTERREPYYLAPGILYVYKGDEKVLYRREALKADFSYDLIPGKPNPPGPSELLNLAQNSTGHSRILSSNVEEFSLEDRTGSKTQFQVPPLVMNLKLRRPLSHSDRFAEFSVQRRFALRNRY